jgi:hypothetical protein
MGDFCFCYTFHLSIGLEVIQSRGTKGRQLRYSASHDASSAMFHQPLPAVPQSAQVQISIPVSRRTGSIAKLELAASVDNQPWWKRGWFHVSPKDHLHRGRDGATLSENIDAYLKLQVCPQDTLWSSLVTSSEKGLEPSDYPFIYLLTSPRCKK